MYRAAMRSIFSELARQDRLIIVDDLSMDIPKTNSLVTKMAQLEANQALIVTSEENRNLELSARNLASISVCTSGEVDPVSLIRHEKVVMTADAAKKIDEALQ